MKLSVIGLPGAGKSTIFDALTQQIAEEKHRGENRLGNVAVPDDRIDVLSRMYEPHKTIYARVDYLLPVVVGQKQDQNLWAAVRDCDALVHVVRNFGGAETPLQDFADMDQEMILTDLMVVEKRLERIELDKKRGKKINEAEVALLSECRKLLEDDTPIRVNPSLAAEPDLRGFAFVSAKPQLLLFNNDDEDEVLPEETGRPLNADKMVIRGKLEQELAGMSQAEAVEFLKEFGIDHRAMTSVLQRSYELLGLISFFTVGKDEVRAWTIHRGTVAVDAADVIHSDIKKGFIRAEVLAYDDLMDAGSHQEAKKKGTVRLEGKTYIVTDGDIINFRFNV